jgi:4-hydroxybenzoate polyprenyltransferase
MQTLRNLLELIRFSHMLFALPFALLSAVMAWTTASPTADPLPFRWRDLAGILLCMVLARSAAMAFNRLADRRWDALNPRTALRHLPAGKISLASVIWFTGLCKAGFIAATLLFLPNRLPLWLSVPVLLVLLAYSYTKRFTALAHFWLGLSLMLAPVSAWIAIRGTILESHPGDIGPAVWLGLAVLLWVAGFDMIYACQDAEFDRQARLRSIPARLGVAVSLRLAAVCHLGTLLVLASLPWLFSQLALGPIYLVAVGLVACLLLYEHWLVTADDLTRVNVAFFQVNAVISLGLFAVGTVDLLLG